MSRSSESSGPSGPTIRVATWEDRAAVASLRRAWAEENAGGPVEDDGFLEAFEAWLEREQHQRVTWLGLADGRPVAMLNLLEFVRMPRPGHLDSRWGYLANCYVLPEYRDAGIGTRLLDACTAYADERGYVRVVLSPTARSVPFYARGGFARATSLMVRHRP